MAHGPQGNLLRKRRDEAVERINRQSSDVPPEAEAYVKSMLGDVYFAIEEYSKAEALQQQALAIRTKHLPRGDESIALSQRFLARTLYARGDSEGAVRLYDEALRTFTKIHGQIHEEVTNTMSEIAAL